MSSNASLAIRIAAIFDNKGLKSAEKGVKSLQSSVKKLAGAAGIGLSTAAMINFGKASAKAFIENEKSARRLAISVKNLGLSFETPRIERFLDEVSRMAGIEGERLRASFQTLLQTTGSVTKSQELLTQALDVSAGSGVELETVASDLAASYIGNNKGLTKYYLGLTKAELKTMTFAEVQKKLNEQFTGANAAYLETYAGKMQVLKEAADGAQEVIGGALLNALTDLFGAQDITELISKIDILAKKTATMIDDLAWKWKKFWFATSDRAILEGFNPFSTYVQDGLKAIDISHKVATAARNATTQGYVGSMPVGIYETAAQKAARAKAEADAAKRAKELAALQKKSLVDAAKKARLESAARKLDLERINITAALKGKISETDKLSLELQLALLNENDTAAQKLSDQLDAAIKRQKELDAALLATPKAPNPFSDWSVPKLDFGGNLLGSQIPNFVPPSWSMPTDSFSQYGPLGGLGAGVVAGVNNGQTPVINVTVELDGQTVGGAIRDTSINDSLSGSFNQVGRSFNKGAVAIL